MPCLGKKRAFAAKLQSLQSTPFFLYVQEEDFNLLARSFTAHRFSKGQTMPESPFYLVVRGELDIVSKGTADILCTKHEGAFFSRNAGILEVAKPPDRFSMRRSEGLANTMRHLKQFASMSPHSSGDRATNPETGQRSDKRRTSGKDILVVAVDTPAGASEPSSPISDAAPPCGPAPATPPTVPTLTAPPPRLQTRPDPAGPQTSTLDLMRSSQPQTTFISCKELCTEAKTNIVAKTEGEVLLLSPAALCRLMARAGPQTNAGVRSMMMSNLEDLLGGVPFIRAAGLERSAVHYIVHYTVHYMVHYTAHSMVHYIAHYMVHYIAHYVEAADEYQVRALGELCSYYAVEAGTEVFAQINIPDAQRKHVLANLEAAGAELFAQARKEAYTLLSRDTLRRFVREAPYRGLVQALQGGQTSTSLTTTPATAATTATTITAMAAITAAPLSNGDACPDTKLEAIRLSDAPDPDAQPGSTGTAARDRLLHLVIEAASEPPLPAAGSGNIFGD